MWKVRLVDTVEMTHLNLIYTLYKQSVNKGSLCQVKGAGHPYVMEASQCSHERHLTELAVSLIGPNYTLACSTVALF